MLRLEIGFGLNGAPHLDITDARYSCSRSEACKKRGECTFDGKGCVNSGGDEPTGDLYRSRRNRR